jgi:hypothetical protein
VLSHDSERARARILIILHQTKAAPNYSIKLISTFFHEKREAAQLMIMRRFEQK